MEQKQHDLVVQLKQLAIELGRTPARGEFALHTGIKRYTIEKIFGSWAQLVAAAGLEPLYQRVTNQIFHQDVNEHISNYEDQPKIVVDRKPYPHLAVISDIHWPFSNQAIVARFVEYVGDEKPDYVVLNGDAWDMYSHAKFPRSHNIFTPQQEEDSARNLNKEFWENILLASPKSKCIQTLGNHDVRPLKRTMETLPMMEHWVTKYMMDLFSFPGVELIQDPRQEYMINDIAIFHGYRSKLGDHRDFTLLNCVNGHSHKGGVVYKRIRGQTLWELNSGYAGDPQAKGLTYTPQKITEWTPGFGVINKYGPQFVPVG